MRTPYTCVICGVTYLPPEAMVYPETGITASPAHCASPACTTAARDGVNGMPLAAVEQLAIAAARERARQEARAARLVSRRSGARQAR